MTLPFLEHMDQLHSDILAMSSIVEENLNEAVAGLSSRSVELAEQLALRDRKVNALDIQIEDECLKILALYHPVANDLRRVAAVLKITGELERVGDLAVNISERSASLCACPEFPLPEGLTAMCSESLSMLRRSIQAFIQLDLEAAHTICAQDDVVDRMNDRLIADLRMVMSSTPETVEPGLHLFSIVRHVERVADHATNIAEDVAYLVSGDIVRHRHGREPKSQP